MISTADRFKSPFRFANTPPTLGQSTSSAANNALVAPQPVPSFIPHITPNQVWFRNAFHFSLDLTLIIFAHVIYLHTKASSMLLGPPTSYSCVGWVDGPSIALWQQPLSLELALLPPPLLRSAFTDDDVVFDRQCGFVFERGGMREYKVRKRRSSPSL